MTESARVVLRSELEMIRKASNMDMRAVDATIFKENHDATQIVSASVIPSILGSGIGYDPPMKVFRKFLDKVEGKETPRKENSYLDKRLAYGSQLEPGIRARVRAEAAPQGYYAIMPSYIKHWDP